jgi:hypothetical protein
VTTLRRCSQMLLVQPEHQHMGHVGGDRHGQHVQWSLSVQPANRQLEHCERDQHESDVQRCHGVQPAHRKLEHQQCRHHAQHVPQCNELQSANRKLGRVQCPARIRCEFGGGNGMQAMFNNASAFNQDLSTWCVSQFSVALPTSTPAPISTGGPMGHSAQLGGELLSLHLR